MAKLTYNIVTNGISGKIGDLLVFKQKNGKTFIGNVPRKRDVNSPVLKTINNRFAEANKYAKKAIFQLDIKARYQEIAKPGQTAYNRAVADFITAPQITHIELINYKGKINDSIRFRVKEPGLLNYVKVSIAGPDGKVIEEGFAVRIGKKEDWEYRSTKKNPKFIGSIVTVTVTNLAGNHTVTDQQVKS